MKVKYRISFRKSDSQKLMAILEQHNIKHKSLLTPGGTDPLISFDVYDTHVVWETISDLVRKNNHPHIRTNIFTKQEIRNAQWCRARSNYDGGYPQPEDEWLSTRFTYANFDPESQTYSNQVQNFRIKKEPRLKNKHFMNLIWPSEIFARIEVIEKLKSYNVKGFVARDVLIHKTGKPSKEIQQIVIPKITEADAILKDHPITSKPSDNVVKYRPHTHGILGYTPELLAESVDFVLSKEWFGYRNAFRLILFSQKVTSLYLDNDWKGLSFEPVQIET